MRVARMGSQFWGNELTERRHGIDAVPGGEALDELHWDVFLAAVAEHVAARDGRDGPVWAGSRSLRRFWFPFNGRAARVVAVVHAPASFRRRGVFVARQELEVA
jgi:hypothetical protein